MLKFTRLICGALLLLFIAFSSNAAVESAKSLQLIRVGCIDLENFIEKKENGIVSGYGVTYLNEIAKYTNWRYEYVSGSWADCLEWLKEGKIDLLMPAEYTEDRGKDYLFSKYSFCTDYAALYAAKNNDSLFYQDYDSFDNIKIGLIKANQLNHSIQKFAAQHRFQPRYFYYDTLSAMTAALRNGEIDAIVNGSLSTASEQKLLAKFDFMPAYFITGKNRPDLMGKLDGAMYEILLDNPYFTAALNERFYSGSNLQVKGFTREETKYINQTAPLTVICNADNYPFEWLNQKSEQFEGIYPDILNAIATQSGLRFKIIATKSPEETKTLLESGNADLILSFYGNALNEQQYQAAYTKPYMKLNYTFIGNRSVTFDSNAPLTVSLHRHYADLENYLREQYPKWTFIGCDTEKTCLEKVRDKNADLTLMNTASIQTSNILSHYPELGVIPTQSADVPISIGISKHQNPLLLSVMNKAISRVNNHQVEQIILRNTFVAPPQVTFYYLLRYYLSELLGVALMMVLSLCAIIVFLCRDRAKTKQNLRLALKNNELKEAVMLAQHADKTRDLYDALYNTIQLGIVQYEFIEDTQQITLLYANKGARTLLQIDTTSAVPLFPSIDESILSSIRSTATKLSHIGDKALFEDEVRAKDKSFWIDGSAELLLHESGKKIIQSTFVDITRRKNFEEQLKYRSETDALTQLFNKGTAETLCRDYLAQIDAQSPAALLALDLDHFKVANDSYGHQYGDEILRNFAAALRRIFRQEDIIGRIGGDEFIILMKNTSDRDAISSKARDVCLQAEAISLKNGKPLISCSIGIALHHGCHGSYDELFRKADQALYQTKEAGKNNWSFFK